MPPCATSSTCAPRSWSPRTRVMERMRLTMSVMFAVLPAPGESRRSTSSTPPAPTSPDRLSSCCGAQDDLHQRLTGLFVPHRDELAVEPEVAALALRSLIFGASRPELGMAPALTLDQIADVLLGGAS